VTAGYDPQEAAARYALNLYEALKQAGAEAADDGRLKAPGLYTRARQFPSLVAQAGLLPAAAFALAKTEDLRAVDEAFNALGGQAGAAAAGRLRSDAAKTGGGYAAIAGLIARILADSGHCSEAPGPVAVWLARCLTGLSQRGSLLAAEALVLEAMQEFKKYVEAFLEKPQREE